MVRVGIPLKDSLYINDFLQDSRYSDSFSLGEHKGKSAGGGEFERYVIILRDTQRNIRRRRFF